MINIYGKLDDGMNDTIVKMSVWTEGNKLCKAKSFGGTNETPKLKLHGQICRSH